MPNVPLSLIVARISIRLRLPVTVEPCVPAVCFSAASTQLRANHELVVKRPGHPFPTPIAGAYNVSAMVTTTHASTAPLPSPPPTAALLGSNQVARATKREGLWRRVFFARSLVVGVACTFVMATLFSNARQKGSPHAFTSAVPRNQWSVVWVIVTSSRCLFLILTLRAWVRVLVPAP